MAIFNYEYTISLLEASKEEADKFVEKGKAVHDTRKGVAIANDESHEPIEPSDHIKYEDGVYDRLRKEYEKKYKVNRDKFNNEKEKTRKEHIRDAFRNSSQVKKSSERYKDIDPEKSTKGMSEPKANAVKRQLEKGGNIPESISKKLVKKQDYTIDPESCRRHGEFFEKTFSDNEEDVMNKLKSLYRIMKDSKNYDEYKDAYDQFTRITGYKDADNIGTVRFYKNKLTFYAPTKKDKEDIAGDSKYFHTTKSDNVKKLYPAFKSTDGVFYRTPRIYYHKDKAGSKLGGGYVASNDHIYSNKFDKNQKMKVDSELNGSARYLETDKAVDTKKEKK